MYYCRCHYPTMMVYISQQAARTTAIWFCNGHLGARWPATGIHSHRGQSLQTMAMRNGFPRCDRA